MISPTKDEILQLINVSPDSETAADDIYRRLEMWVSKEARQRAQEMQGITESMANIGGVCVFVLVVCLIGFWIHCASVRASDYEFWETKVCSHADTQGCIQAVGSALGYQGETTHSLVLRAMYKAAASKDLPLPVKK